MHADGPGIRCAGSRAKTGDRLMGCSPTSPKVPSVSRLGSCGRLPCSPDGKTRCTSGPPHRDPSACSAGCRPDRKRQVRARPRAGRAPERHHRQRRLHAGVSRAARPHRPPDTGGGGARATRPLRRASRRAAGQRRLVARRGLRRDANRARRGSPADRHRRQRPVFRVACQGPRRHPLPYSAGPRRSPRFGSRHRRPGAARAAGDGRPRHGRETAAQRPPARRPRLGGVAQHRHRPRRLAGAGAAARPHGASPPFCSIPHGTTCAPPLPPASMPCWPRAQSTRSAPCWPSTSTRLSRRCARTACRSCPPTCGGNHSGPGSHPHRSVTGQYTKRQTTWFRHHALAARTHTIHARFTGLTQFSERNLDKIVAFVQDPG